MKAKPSLIWPNSAVKLYAVAGIHLNLSLVVHPRNAELNLPLRFYQPLQQRVFFKLLLIGLHDYPQRLKNFFYRLMELWLRRILRYYSL